MIVSMDVLRGYLVKMQRREGWRMRSWSDEDYVQEGLLVYLTVEKHYPNVIEPKHLMSLFKTSWSNHMHDKAKKERPTDGDSALEHLEAQVALIPYEDAMCAARRMSGDAKALVDLLTSPSEVITEAIRGIVFTSKQVRAIASRLNSTVSRVRTACIEIFQEFAMPSHIQILATATGILQQGNEERQQYLTRLVNATASLSEEAWNALPVDTQGHFNAMADAVNASKEIPDLPDEGPVAADGDEKKAAAAPKKKTATRRVPPPPAKKKAAKATAAADATAAPEDKKDEAVAASNGTNGSGAADTAAEAPEDKKPSATARARRMMVLDDKLAAADVRKVLIEEGYAPPALSSIQAMRSEIKSCKRILTEVGLLK